MRFFHIFAENIKQAADIANELNKRNFVNNYDIYQKRDEILIKFTVILYDNRPNPIEDTLILEDIRLRFGL